MQIFSIIVFIFRNRINVTLSCLIVEAGIYSQINIIMPISASPKAIDIFFFYTIVRLFLVCLHHTLNYRFIVYQIYKANSDNKKKQSVGVSKTISFFQETDPIPKEIKYNRFEPLETNINQKVLKFNIISFIVYTLADIIFLSIYSYEIISIRRNVSASFV